jgi:hypothetical protein
MFARPPSAAGSATVIEGLSPNCKEPHCRSAGGKERALFFARLMSCRPSSLGRGLGVYSFFNQGVDIRADRAIEVPKTPGARFHNTRDVT